MFRPKQSTTWSTALEGWYLCFEIPCKLFALIFHSSTKILHRRNIVYSVLFAFLSAIWRKQQKSIRGWGSRVMWCGTAQGSWFFFRPIFHIPDTQQQTQNVGFEFIEACPTESSNSSPVLNYGTHLVRCQSKALTLNVIVAFLSATWE